MRVLYGLVDMSICRKCCESTTEILYPIGGKIPRPNIYFADGNRSVYKRLGVTTKCVPNCHFLRRGCRLAAKILRAKLKCKPFRFEPHKFVAAELTPLASQAAKPAPARECPIQQTSDAHRHDDVAVAIRLIGKRAHLPRALFVF